MTTDTRDRIRSAALPGWEWDSFSCQIRRGDSDIGISQANRKSVIEDDGPYVDDGLVGVMVEDCEAPVDMTPAQLVDLAMQLLAVARALSPFTAPDDHTRGLRDAAEFARGMMEQSPDISASEIVTALDLAAGVEATIVEARAAVALTPGMAAAAAEWARREVGPIAVAPQEPMPDQRVTFADQRVTFVLGLLRNVDLHGGGVCRECTARIAEAAGVSVEEVEREWRRMEDKP